MDTEPLPMSSSEVVNVCTKYKYISVCVFVAEECSVFSLVRVINDQGIARITIDYIKKKQTDPGVSSCS